MADKKSPEEGVDEDLESDLDAEDAAKNTSEKDQPEESAEEGAGDDAAEDVPETSEDVPETGEDVPETSEDVPETGEDVPETGEDVPETVESLRDLLSEAETRAAELKDQALRAKADVENVRRRAARDVENAHKYALEKMITELLPVLDSLEKAVESAAVADDAGVIGEGVELSLKLFLNALSKVGVVPLDPIGEPFDPQFHEAIAMVENPDGEPNSVMEVIQRGYSLNGRLVRAAKVVVVKAVTPEEPSEENSSE